MNYYETLNISCDATKTEIKRAYFEIIKKFPPERFPEEFKVYRKAYETLSDEEKREEYNRFYRVPEKYLASYKMANEHLQYGEVKQAIAVLKKIAQNKPEFENINALLGVLYLLNGNSGNAKKIFEYLTKEFPENVNHRTKLGDSYFMLGYRKKAIAEYETAIKIDVNNPLPWISLSELYLKEEGSSKSMEIIEKAILSSDPEQEFSYELHACLVVLLFEDNKTDLLEEQLKILKAKIEGHPVRIKHVYNLFEEKLLNIYTERQFFERISFIFEFMKNVNNSEDAVKSLLYIKEALFMEKIMQDEKIDENLKYMTIECKNFRELSKNEVEITKLIIEIEIIEKIDTIRNKILYFKQNYPEAYKLHEKFYNNVLNPKKEQYLKESTYKKLLEYKRKYPDIMDKVLSNSTEDISEIYKKDDFDDDYYDENDILRFFDRQEPFVREEKKVGRNEPCPCGSGKKYKKCCGAS